MQAHNGTWLKIIVSFAGYPFVIKANPKAVPPPSSTHHRGTQGYEEQIEQTLAISESIDCTSYYAPISHLFPAHPVTILDVGCCSGRDAAFFAKMGYKVSAAEPVRAFLDFAKQTHTQHTHKGHDIKWYHDGLPHLASIMPPLTGFDLITLNAVWMHLNKKERNLSMCRLASMLTSQGILILSLRHGPIPPQKRMYHIHADDVINQAESNGLSLILKLENQPSGLNRKDITWTRLAFRAGNNHVPQQIEA